MMMMMMMMMICYCLLWFNMLFIGMICWDNDGIFYWDIDGYTPLVNIQKAIEHGPFMVDLYIPINN